MASFPQTNEGVVDEMMKIYRSLPARPSMEKVEAAREVIKSVEREEQAKLKAISEEEKGVGMHGELFSVLQEMHRNLVSYQRKQERKEADTVMDLESFHVLFDGLIQKASEFVPGTKKSGAGIDSFTSSVYHGFRRPQNQREVGGSSSEFVTRDDSFIDKTKAAPFPHKQSRTVGDDGNKSSFIELASLIEVSAKNGIRELDLRKKLDQIDRLPDSIQKLSKLVKLDLSQNKILVIPKTIGSLTALSSLDIHSNIVVELPDSIGNLSSLVYLNLRANQLNSLPASIGKLSRLTEIDLCTNRLLALPDTIGNLVGLKKLNIDSNLIEELPYRIGHCSSLVELRAEYNHLKGLPEAVGNLQTLQVLTLRFNNIKLLPTTMASMSHLRELDLSFNELESIPESLCLVTSLVKLNLGNNFAVLKHLPRGIGNLEMLDELDISNNQIKILPDSFAKLSNLRVLNVEHTPLEVPPLDIAATGAQEVIHYMAQLVAKRDANQSNKLKLWARNLLQKKEKKRDILAMDYR